jgi:hypothetical protein
MSGGTATGRSARPEGIRTDFITITTLGRKGSILRWLGNGAGSAAFRDFG